MILLFPELCICKSFIFFNLNVKKKVSASENIFKLHIIVRLCRCLESYR